MVFASDRPPTVSTAWRAGVLSSRCAVEEGAEVEGGLAVGDHPDGFGFADIEGVGVTQGLQLGGLVTDQVVKGGEVQGVAGDLQMGGADPVVGTVGADPAVEQPHPPGVPAVLLPGLQQVRVVGGDGLGDRELDRPPPTRADPVRELGVHRCGGGLGEVVGGLGDLAGLPRRHRQRFDRGPEPGESVLEVQGVGQQLEPGQGGHPERGGERFGRERRHQRRPLPTESCLFVRAQARQAGVGPGHKPRLGGGRVQHTPPGGGPQLGSAGLAFADLGVGGEVEQPLRVEARTSTRLPFNIVSSMSQSKQQAPTVRPRNRGWRRGLWRSIFEVFRQPRLGCGGSGWLGFQANPLWLRPCLRLRVRGRGRRPGSFFTVVADAPLCESGPGRLLHCLPA